MIKKLEWVRMIEDVNGKFDDYSISPEIRQILLHWGYELVKNNLLWFFLFHIKMSLINCGGKEKVLS